MSADPAAPRRVRQALRPLLVLAAVVAALAVAQVARERLGIEWSADSVREAVRGFGWWAPLGFLALVLGRQLLALPSVLVLTSAGLLFGAALGTLLGGLGMAANACLLFATARLLGREQVLPLVHSRWPDFEARAQAAGPPFIALMTGHPMGVLTPFHFAAGVTGISWGAFLAAVLPTAPIRAACYSLLGAHLLDPTSPGFWLATALLAAVALLPLAHPRVRARLVAGARAPRSDGPPNQPSQ
jgi:uncharacterized membrane protein YdjX (TVP38/TMEM64 family)